MDAAFDSLAAAQQLTDQLVPRLDTLNLGPQDYQEDLDIIQEFNKIAAGMLKEEQGIEMPGPDGAKTVIPLDERTFMQGLALFGEGVYFSLSKCAEMGITGDIKKHLLQNLAMDIYMRAKEIVASTYGQEHTPGFQFSFEQQVEFVNQSAESSLMYYIGEYERENGPIQPVEPVEPAPAASAPAAMSPAEAPADMPAPEPRPSSGAGKTTSPAVPPPARPKGPTPHDKYGAVALLLTTLPANKRSRILDNFNPDEKELIAFYSYPQHIEQNLDTACVQEHLKRFRETLRQGGSTLKSGASQGIARLCQSYPAEKLLSYVTDERPLVKAYLEGYYQHKNVHPLSRVTASGSVQKRHFSEPLPGRIEDILYRYLSKRLEPSA